MNYSIYQTASSTPLAAVMAGLAVFMPMAYDAERTIPAPSRPIMPEIRSSYVLGNTGITIRINATLTGDPVVDNYRPRTELGRKLLALRRTYVTTGGQLLDDPDRALVASDAVRLEVQPKPCYEKRQQEIEFYDTVLGQAEHLKWCTDTLYHAHDLAAKHGIAAMDAIHIATALDAGVEEFVTAEKSTKPMFRVTELHMQSIR